MCRVFVSQSVSQSVRGSVASRWQVGQLLGRLVCVSVKFALFPVVCVLAAYQHCAPPLFELLSIVS